MASPNNLEAQFAPGGSLRIVDAALYAQIRTDYGIGINGNGNVLFGVSPATLVARYGVAFVDNPTAGQYLMLEPLGTVFTTSSNAASQVLGHTVSSSADGINTQVAAYTDPNGQVFSSVTWEWQIEVVLYQVADSSQFTAEVVTWTGDGSVVARQITTAANLSTGVTMILVLPQTTHTPTMCTSDMIANGKHATVSRAPASTTAGIMAMNATGFTILDDQPNSIFLNSLNDKYTALVFHDAGTRMACGTYVGNDTIRSIPTGNIGPTMVFVAGRSGTFQYAETDHMPAGTSLAWSSAEAKALTGAITAINPTGTFTLGALDNNVNNSALTYYWTAIGIGASDTIRNFFNTYKITGTGSAIDHVTGLAFTPVWAWSRPAVAGAPSAVWRGPHNTGTTSQFTAAAGAVASGGIESFASGDIGIGDTVAPNGTDVYGFALAVSGTSNQAETLTWIKETSVPNPDGTVSVVQTITQSNASPGDDYSIYNPIDTTITPTSQWWCNAAFGYAIYQVDSPGAGWVACSGPASDNGWYLSTEGFGAQDTIIVSAGKPADPRAWIDIVTWATGNSGMLGGSPGASCILNNQLVYPGTDYTVGTTAPTMRLFNGRTDNGLCTIPNTAAGVVSKAVMSVLAANGTVYLSTWDTGTTSVDWVGRVFELDVSNGNLTLLGAAFAAGEMPYALAWHMGRLWCGTNNGIGTVGKVYFFRPGIDTTWTQDFATSTLTAGGVDSMVSYKGKLYVGTDNAAASRGKVLVRDTAGAYTLSQTGAGGASAVRNNGYLSLCVFGGNLYASYWNNDTTAYSKIEKFTGSAWSDVYVGASGTLRPFIVLAVDDGVLYAVGGGKLLSAAIVTSANGTLWTDMTAELPETDTTLLPMFGAVVL